MGEVERSAMARARGRPESGEKKDVFTTGEVADVCRISQQTVIRCFDSGRLQGFRVPGSRFRRIPRDSLIRFMRENGIPLDQLKVGKKRVLVVDDEPAMVEMLVELLERDGRFEVQTASTGFDAGLRTKEFCPDVVVLDWLLPDINGNAVIRSIRADPSARDVKIIIVSGVAGEGDLETAPDLRPEAFMRKPFDIEQLVRQITELACE
jgi:excisionase family DNA binding protein